jgi:hypothetical protein
MTFLKRRGSLLGQVNFGVSLLMHHSLPKNHAEAARYLTTEADKQDIQGMLHYAPCLFNVKEVPDAESKAVRQDPFGKANLGFSLHEDVGVARYCLS